MATTSSLFLIYLVISISQCIASSNIIQCSAINGCLEYTNFPDHPCPVCVKQGCLYEDQVYQIGENFRPDDCTSCTCHIDGIYRCRGMRCRKPKCANPVKAAGECCSTCPKEKREVLTCTLLNGQTILHQVGESVKVDTCGRECICSSGGEALCDPPQCFIAKCSNPYKLPNCCNICLP
ncbi:cysteine-rich motor neuron 1 protein-like [Anneissia japonica]|uniref:cysteine-rich motor neuron 1 protein-like n=1 Tax=Anneissia japonica TaxID=1529436 RepID=UPI001425AE39|nr:cysteine-rich motor neuron 1 protein-like [Anneissia japonica]